MKITALTQYVVLDNHLSLTVRDSDTIKTMKHTLLTAEQKCFSEVKRNLPSLQPYSSQHTVTMYLANACQLANVIKNKCISKYVDLFHSHCAYWGNINRHKLKVLINSKQITQVSISISGYQKRSMKKRWYRSILTKKPHYDTL